jgi:hypothetical protein
MDKKNKFDDQTISKIVQSVSYQIPETVEARVTAAINKNTRKKTKRVLKPYLWYPVSAAIAIIIIAAIFVFLPFMKNSEEITPITEIKTEFELTETNIKIIWVQKKDFKLN